MYGKKKAMKTSGVFHNSNSFDTSNNYYSLLIHSNISKSSRLSENTFYLSPNMVNLQKIVGNQAVQRYINTGKFPSILQISQPGDEYEKEADFRKRYENDYIRRFTVIEKCFK